MNMFLTNMHKHAAVDACTCTEPGPCMQHCRSCGQVKASEEFPRNRMNKDGLHSYCKPCQNAKCAQYQRNSLAAKQEGIPVAESPADVALRDEPFPSHKVLVYAYLLKLLSSLGQALFRLVPCPVLVLYSTAATFIRVTGM